MLYFESKRLWQTFLDIGINNEYTFDNDGIFVSNKENQEKYPWEKILSWKLNKKYVLILMNKNFFITIIQEQLNDEEKGNLIALLKNKLGNPKFR
jgi:hypothetical protein